MTQPTSLAPGAEPDLERRVTDALASAEPDHDPVRAVLALIDEVSSTVRTEAYAVERQAASLCGPETYLRGGIHRPYWRRRARAVLASA